MQMRFLGDSYDIVKQALLRWLQPLGEWSVHPMITEEVSPDDVSAYASLMGAKVVSRDVLVRNTDRLQFFLNASRCGHLFLDPDTGLRMRPTRGKRAPEYLFASELVHLCEQRRESLTLVFDQSVGRGSELEHLQRKDQELSSQGVYVSAYMSHACFVIASCDPDLVERARSQILSVSELPDSRFLSVAATS